MFLSRFFGRTALLAAAKSETSAAAAAASTAPTILNPLEQFFEADRPEEGKPVYGKCIFHFLNLVHFVFVCLSSRAVG